VWKSALIIVSENQTDVLVIEILKKVQDNQPTLILILLELLIRF